MRRRALRCGDSVDAAAVVVGRGWGWVYTWREWREGGRRHWRTEGKRSFPHLGGKDESAEELREFAEGHRGLVVEFGARDLSVPLVCDDDAVAERAIGGLDDGLPRVKYEWGVGRILSPTPFPRQDGLCFSGAATGGSVPD